MAKNPPLSGLTVLVTRPEHQANDLIEQLESAGATVLHQPAIEIRGIPHPVIAQAPEHYDVIIFISQNAVKFGLNSLPVDSTIPSAIAAIGKATSRALKAHGFNNILQPDSGFTSEDLLALPPFDSDQIANRSILIIRGGAGRETLKQVLEQRGAKVDYLDVYERHPAKPVISAEQIKASDCITVSSQQGLENLLALYDLTTRQQLFDKLLIVPSQRCQQKALEIGFSRVEIAANATDSAMLNCIIDNMSSAISHSS